MRTELSRRLLLLEGQGGRGPSPEEAAAITWLLDEARAQFPALVAAVEDAGGGRRGAAAMCDLLEAVDPALEEQFWRHGKAAQE